MLLKGMRGEHYRCREDVMFTSSSKTNIYQEKSADAELLFVQHNCFLSRISSTQQHLWYVLNVICNLQYSHCKVGGMKILAQKHFRSSWGDLLPLSKLPQTYNRFGNILTFRLTLTLTTDTPGNYWHRNMKNLLYWKSRWECVCV